MYWEDTSFLNAFSAANDVLLNAVKGIAEIINCRGLINVDFADVRTVMSEMGMAMMGSGLASGEERAEDAAETAISSPLMEDINIEGAKGVLVNVTAGENLTLQEFHKVGTIIKNLASEDATIVIGTVIDPELDDGMRVTVVATGLGARNDNVEAPSTLNPVRTDRRARGQNVIKKPMINPVNPNKES